ncbi:hypothetical protein M8I34_01305 [Streptomyces sp. MCA2]|uniref:hypothetical protein n=1 Tax=Streptomyces TaxID=1883 RepID=UPI002021339F|nr:hypothetical protein [Streptomyces sp. MCA2]MCL7490104.1 hypothetical protein [Streptomyces sp. MCA2]
MPMAGYKSARAEAEHIAALLRAALMRAGIPETQVAQVRPQVTAAGRAYVHLGAFRIGDAGKLLDALPLDTRPTDDADGPTLTTESFR